MIPRKLAQGSYLTTGGSDPLLPKLVQAINNSTDIDISVSFIMNSGLELLIDPLKEALEKNAKIRILTSDYLFITQPKALKNLLLLGERGADIRVFTCCENVSFHMKSYIFVRTENNTIIEGCAFVGSNNISKGALTNGHEWCLRQDWNSSVDSIHALEFQNIRNQFENIFFHPQSINLSNTWLEKYTLSYEKHNPKTLLRDVNPGFDNESLDLFRQTQVEDEFSDFKVEDRQKQLLRVITNDVDENELEFVPTSFQEEALKALNQARFEGYKRGLVVMATGMGKT